jgi:NADH-quinone oxidoreductase subunit L
MSELFEPTFLIVMIPALPLAAAIITLVFGARLLKDQSHVPLAVAVPASFVLSLVLLRALLAGAPPASQAARGQEEVRVLWTWTAVEGAYTLDGRPRDLRIDVALRADPLTGLMLAMVTFVSSLVVVYSIGYMKGDPGYRRFFTYVGLFVFSMAMLVTVSNFALLYVFWEAVGVCSYLLIGFWYHKPEAAAAAKKAFLVNRVGDFGMALAVFLIWTTYGTLDFHDTRLADGTVAEFGVLGQARLADGLSAWTGGGVGLAIALLLFAGACGKSAQFPLHVWLPDAMEGPTPVSALIHAATMVTAGVYLVARATPLFAVAPYGQETVAAIGAVTAVLAGIIALTQNDLKRVLAYSTVSQLGFMFLSLGTGSLAGITAGMFHLFTHAFFKALLFLGAGSVMHAMGGVIDVREFGGLRKLMPITFWTFLAGSLALAGIFPLAGFFSKDAILSAVHHRAEHGGQTFEILYLVSLGAALLTSVYTFRAVFLTFMGKEKIPQEAGHHAHESPNVMTVPLVMLAIGSLIVGWWHPGITRFLARTPALLALPAEARGPAGEFHGEMGMLSTIVALAGLGLAAYLYLGDREEVSWMARIGQGLARFAPGVRPLNALARLFVVAPLRGLYRLSHDKFYLDELYRAVIVAPVTGLAWLANAVDHYLIDWLVDAVGRLPGKIGQRFQPLQSGLVPFYAMVMALGIVVLVGTVVLWGVMN